MAHRYRLTPTPEQAAGLVEHCAHARFVWNVALEQANMYRPHWGATPNAAARQRQLAEARKAEPWLAAGSSSVQQQALRQFDQALKNWWAGTHGRPTWRNRHRHNSFVVRDVNAARLSRKWATINVPKIGRVKFRLSRPLPAAHGMATISLDRSGRWHVSFAAPQPAVNRESTGAVVGVDLGIARTVTTSDGVHLDMPPLLSPGERARLLRLQRKLARQMRGSVRRETTRVKIAKLKTRETDRRKDWIEQTTTRLVRDHDLIAIEDLKVANMVRSAKGTVEAPGVNVAAKAGLNREIHARAWSQFRTRLEQKAAAATQPCVVAAVNPRHTSQRCHECGHTAPENRRNQHQFSCAKCGHTANADVNAAINILRQGMPSTDAEDRHQPPSETSTTRRAA